MAPTYSLCHSTMLSLCKIFYNTTTTWLESNSQTLTRYVIISPTERRSTTIIPNNFRTLQHYRIALSSRYAIRRRCVLSLLLEPSFGTTGKPTGCFRRSMCRVHEIRRETMAAFRPTITTKRLPRSKAPYLKLLFCIRTRSLNCQGYF